MVSRAWTTSNPKTGRVFSEDFVLVDEQGSSIHAKAPGNLRSKYRNLVKEGCIYKIHKFKVLGYTTFYRPLEREFYIEFITSTFVQTSTIGQQLFPRFVFEFVQFDKLADRIDDDTYLTNVIGVLCEWGPLEKKDVSVCHNGKLRKIVIVDTGDVRLNISLWGECALKYPDDLIQSQKDTNIVVVLTGCRVRKFGRLPQLSTTVASQFHLNPRIIQVATYNQRPIHPVVFTSTDPQCEELTITSIPDLYKYMVDGVDVETKFIIQGTVINFDVSKDWKYIQCATCLRGVQFRGVRYYCAHCNQNVTPRQAYRLVVQVHSNKESMDCVLFKDNADNLIGCTVDELIARESQEGVDDPNCIIDFFITSLIGVPVVFGIKVDQYNMKPEFSRRFTVTKYSGAELGDLNNVNAIMPRVVPPLLPVVTNRASTLDSDLHDYEMQSKVTDCEEAMMDEIQWGPRVTSTTINEAPILDSNGTNVEPLDKINECNIINDVAMEDKDKIIKDADDSKVQDTIQVVN